MLWDKNDRADTFAPAAPPGCSPNTTHRQADSAMNIREYLSEAEFREITRKSDLQAASKFLFDWGVIFATFWLVAHWTSPLSILAAILILGARQLGLGVLVHECGHRILFKTPALNDFCGKWLAGYPIFSDKEAYMRVHLVHHQKAGTPEDPDLSNYQDYPIPRSRLRRKIWRDLSGQIGWRRVRSIGNALLAAGKLKPATRQYLFRSLGMNAGLLLALALAGYAWLYLLWIAAFMTSHMLVSRLRQIGEHAAVTDLFSSDPRNNTRTVYANWLQRFLIAPHQVSYHLEHHLLPAVPIYRLEQMHHMLLKQGFYRQVDFPRGDLKLLQQVTYAG